MELALTLNCWNDEDLVFAQQFGVNHILAQPILPAPGVQRWDERALAALRNRVEQAGLQLVGFDGLPCPLDRSVRGETGRDDEIAVASQFITAAGAAGIPLITYGWALSQHTPSSRMPVGRGQSHVNRVAAPIADPMRATQTGWESYTYFLARVIPVAERANVRLACQPNSPFKPGLLNSTAALQQLLDTAPSHCHGLDLQHGALTHMPAADLLQAIQHFVKQGRVFCAQAQHIDVRTEGIAEGFLDERSTTGPAMLDVLQAYRAAGYNGDLRPAPPPGVTGDTEWGHKGHAFHAGYLKSLLQVARRLPEAMAQ
ncbi:MAG: mannonate dehydratase [Chloroflexi bacterium]|nr:mannonate dehydratase [Chloroflexota bacterium]